MRTLHSSQIPGAAEEVQPMLFTESASTPTVSSTPFTLAPPHSCESKSCDFLLWNICLLICPWVISKLPHLLPFDPLNDTAEMLRWRDVFGRTNGLTCCLLLVGSCCIKSGMNFKRDDKNLFSAFASEMLKNAGSYFDFDFTEQGHFKSWW